MNVRHLITAPLMATAVACPYLAMEDEWRRPSSSETNLASGELAANLPPLDASLTPSLETPEPGFDGAADSAASAQDGAAPATPAIPPFGASGAQFAGAPVADFAEVLRFDISPEWIFTRWSRVTTITADQALKGFRAPLVTGPRVDDLAGVATFYFGRYGHLQRIAFEGHTGDPRRLVTFLTQHYAFKPEPNLGAGLYLVRWNAQPMSALRLDYAPVVRADAPHLRYTVKLEINRPDMGYSMSNDFLQVLGHDQATRRWLPY